MPISTTGSQVTTLATSFESGVDTMTVNGAWRQLLASSAARAVFLHMSGNILAATAAQFETIEIGKGAGGSEVVIGTIYRYQLLAGALEDDYTPDWEWSMAVDIAKATRFASRMTGSVNTAGRFTIGYTIGEIA